MCVCAQHACFRKVLDDMFSNFVPIILVITSRALEVPDYLWTNAWLYLCLLSVIWSWYQIGRRRLRMPRTCWSLAATFVYVTLLCTNRNGQCRGYSGRSSLHPTSKTFPSQMFRCDYCVTFDGISAFPSTSHWYSQSNYIYMESASLNAIWFLGVESLSSFDFERSGKWSRCIMYAQAGDRVDDPSAHKIAISPLCSIGRI